MIGYTLQRTRTRVPISLTIIMLLVVVALLPSLALGDTVTLRMVTWMSSKGGTYRILQTWADEVNQASGGTLTVAIDAKPTSKPTQQYDLVKTGETDLAWHIPTYTAKQFPMLLAAELPFLMANPVTDSQALWAWYTQHVGDKEYGPVKPLTFWLPGEGLLHSKRELKTLDDLHGIKISVAGGIGAATAKAIGCDPSRHPMTKLSTLLQDGVIEGALTGWQPLKGFRLASVLPYHLEVPAGALYTTPFALLMNRTKFDSLSPEHQAVLENLGGTYAAALLSKQTEMWKLQVRKEVEAMPGHVTHKVDAAELVSWQKKLAPLEVQWADMATANGYDGAALLKELKVMLKTYAAQKS